MKKIAIVISDVNQCGGTERTVISVANYLSSKGYQVQFISLFSNDGDIPFFDIENNIKIMHLGISSYSNGSIIKKIIGWSKSLFKFRGALKLNRTDLIIGTSRNTNFLSVIFKTKNQKIIGCEHFAYNVPMNEILRKIRNFTYKRLNRLVVLTEKDRSYYSKKGILTDIIPNALPFLSNYATHKEKLAIAIGRHTDQKAFDELITIWKSIEENTSEWQLYIIGEGPLKNQNMSVAKQLKCKRIKFLPFTKQIGDLYNSASIYLMTSIYEAFPMVLIEAKNHGCVCISYDCDTGPSEIIKHNDGIIIPNRDRSLFIKQLTDVMNDDTILSKMSKQARLNSMEYTKDEIYPKWISLINQL